MATIVIIYDINKEGAGYAAANKKLTDRIRALFKTFWHHLDSTWIVVTDLTTTAIRDDLKKYMDSNDELLVFHSGDKGSWFGFDKAGSDWLMKHL